MPVMERTVNIAALLFSTISLSMIVFTNRFLALSGLSRNLHEKLRTNSDTVYVAQMHK